MNEQIVKVKTKPLIKTFKIFQELPELVHGFSTRVGGLSQPPFDSLNLGLSTPDDTDVVKKNRHLFFESMGISETMVAIPQQVHSSHVKIAEQPGVYSQCDALISAQPNLFLTVQTADCFPVFIFDVYQKVVAIVHSGWRGTAQNIVGKTIRLMQDKFASRPQNMLVAIGPGVQQSCYQVDEQTAQHFEQKFLLPDVPGHFKLDILANIIEQIQKEGVLLNNLEWETTCTHCAADLYYSYRRDGKQSGRMMGLIGLKKQ